MNECLLEQYDEHARKDDEHDVEAQPLGPFMSEITTLFCEPVMDRKIVLLLCFVGS